TGKYFNIDTQGFGIPFAIIFRPDDIQKIAEDDTFHVQISGLYNHLGMKETIEFQTTFFKMLPEFVPRKTILLRVGESVPLNLIQHSPLEQSTFEVVDDQIISIDQSGVVTALREGYSRVVVNDYLRQRSSVSIQVTGEEPQSSVSEWA